MKQRGPGQPAKDATKVIAFRVRKKRVKKLKPQINALIHRDTKQNP